jgi:hypothetical protein
MRHLISKHSISNDFPPQKVTGGVFSGLGVEGRIEAARAKAVERLFCVYTLF